MHQYSADRVVAQPLLFVSATVDALRKANGMRITTLIGELGCVLQHQDRTLGSIVALSGRGEMTVEDITFLNIRVGEKPISRFRVGPVLAGERNRAAHMLAELSQKFCAASAKASILETPRVYFLLAPMAVTISHHIVSNRHKAPPKKNQVLDTESLVILSIQDFSESFPKRVSYLWVIASFTVGLPPDPVRVFCFWFPAYMRVPPHAPETGCDIEALALARSDGPLLFYGL